MTLIFFYLDVTLPAFHYTPSLSARCIQHPMGSWSVRLAGIGYYIKQETLSQWKRLASVELEAVVIAVTQTTAYACSI